MSLIRNMRIHINLVFIFESMIHLIITVFHSTSVILIQTSFFSSLLCFLTSYSFYLKQRGTSADILINLVASVMKLTVVKSKLKSSF